MLLCVPQKQEIVETPGQMGSPEGLMVVAPSRNVELSALFATTRLLYSFEASLMRIERD